MGPVDTEPGAEPPAKKMRETLMFKQLTDLANSVDRHAGRGRQAGHSVKPPVRIERRTVKQH